MPVQNFAKTQGGKSYRIAEVLPFARHRGGLMLILR